MSYPNISRHEINQELLLEYFSLVLDSFQDHLVNVSERLALLQLIRHVLSQNVSIVDWMVDNVEVKLDLLVVKLQALGLAQVLETELGKVLGVVAVLCGDISQPLFSMSHLIKDKNWVDILWMFENRTILAKHC
jgi:hypothetical protein